MRKLVIGTLFVSLVGCDGHESKSIPIPDKIVYYSPISSPMSASVTLPEYLGERDVGGFKLPEPVVEADMMNSPNKYVGMINDDRCTATLLDGTNMVITAAHCVLNYENLDTVAADDVFRLAAKGRDESPGFQETHRSQIVCVAFMDEYFFSERTSTSIDDKGIMSDIAIALLESPAPINSPLKLDQSNSDKTFSISGYPSNFPPVVPTGNVMTRTTAEARLSNSQWLMRTGLFKGSSGSSLINGTSINGILSAMNFSTGATFGAPIKPSTRALFDFVASGCVNAPQDIEAIELSTLRDQQDQRAAAAYKLPRSKMRFLESEEVASSSSLDRLVHACMESCDANEGTGDEFCIVPRRNLYQETLRKLTSLFDNAEDRTHSAGDLMTLFEIEEDECGRSNLILEDGILRNVGETACRIDVGNGLEISIPRTITIPGSFANDRLLFDLSESNIFARLEIGGSAREGILPFVMEKDQSIYSKLGDRCIKLGAI